MLFNIRVAKRHACIQIVSVRIRKKLAVGFAANELYSCRNCEIVLANRWFLG